MPRMSACNSPNRLGPPLTLQIRLGEQAPPSSKQSWRMISNYLLRNDLGVADTYLFAVERWSFNCGISLEKRPGLKGFDARVEARPPTKAVLKAGGLLELFNKS
jgi:glutathione S-transferase